LRVEQPPIVLVGHSMGGAVAVRCAASKVHAAMLHLAAATQQLTHVAQVVIAPRAQMTRPHLLVVTLCKSRYAQRGLALKPCKTNKSRES